jgi:histone deacetylase 11
LDIRLVYSPRYNIRFGGIERLHPFDSRKYGRAWEELFRRFGDDLNRLSAQPAAPADDAALLRVHDAAYLKQLRSARYLEQALELPYLRYVPAWLLRQAILQPMRWGVAGTILASRLALDYGVSVNFSGGYHHASPRRGEGFCLYSDVPVAVASLRAEGRLSFEDRVGLIDLDAHQGNGFERAFESDASVVIIDVYNRDIFPQDQQARRRIDVDVPLRSGTEDQDYLEAVQKGLTAFFQKLGPGKLIFYNAGTDIFNRDRLGGLSVSLDGVLQRDVMVFRALIDRKLPFALLPSGGYTQESYSMIARSASWLVEHIAGFQPAAQGSW